MASKQTQTQTLPAQGQTAEGSAELLERVIDESQQLPDFVAKAIALIKSHQAAGPCADVPRGVDLPAREALVESARKAQEKVLVAERKKVEAAIKLKPELVNALVVADFFINAPEGTGLSIKNTAAPRDAVPDILEEAGENYKFIQLAIVQNVDAEITKASDGTEQVFLPVDPLSATLASYASRGVCGHLFAQIEPRPYSELLPRLNKYSLLGSQPGRESNQVFVDRVISETGDPEGITKRSALGALLGRRVYLDATVHIAEPMHGDRGGVGSLQGVIVAPAPGSNLPYLAEQRKSIIQCGINTLRKWAGVGAAVADSNASLKEGHDPKDPDGLSVYTFASTTRLRSSVQATFHATAEHMLVGAGQRDAGPCEDCTAAMNRLLQDLVQRGWLKKGSEAVVDYDSFAVDLSVLFKPVPPIVDVKLRYSERPYSDRKVSK